MALLRQKHTQLFATTIPANHDAARFFRRWLALHDMGWQRKQVFELLQEDASLPADWRKFAADAHAALVPPTFTPPKRAKLLDRKQRKVNKKLVAEAARRKREFPDASYRALLHVYETSPLLTTYTRGVLRTGNTIDALRSLLAVYDFEEQLV